MAEVAVVGAGHAGVEAAFVLAHAGHAVTIWSDEPDAPYFRPRVIAVAFGQVEPAAIAMKPEGAYAAAGIRVRHEVVTAVDVAARRVNGEVYDGVILAMGAHPFKPAFSGAYADRVRTLWSLQDARVLRSLFSAGKRLTVIGGGVLGLEAALRAVQAGAVRGGCVQVTVLEVSGQLAGGTLGAAGSAYLQRLLEAQGLRVILEARIAEVLSGGIRLESGAWVEDDVVLCAAGSRPNEALIAAVGLSVEQGVRVRPNLLVAPRVYAVGDVARATVARPVCSVRRAMGMGVLAAENLVRELAGSAELTVWQERQFQQMMKVGEVEFHTVGDVLTPGLEERRLDEADKTFRQVRFRAGRPVGARFIGTREGFAEWERKIVG